jgi:hypothetical protein
LQTGACRGVRQPLAIMRGSKSPLLRYLSQKYQ